MSRVRWDGHRLLFVLTNEDGDEVRCAISRLALLAVSSGGGPFQGMDLLRRFASVRSRLEAAAVAKLRERTSAPLGILHIWEDDVLDPPPPATTPVQAARRCG